MKQRRVGQVKVKCVEKLFRKQNQS